MPESSQPYNPAGQYAITDEQAEVWHPSYQYSSEIRVRWLPDDAEHQPLNDMLEYISVLELDHLAKAVVGGESFTVDELEEILPRPGWEIETQVDDNPAQYRLQKKGERAAYQGSRREFLLLMELAVRSAIAPHIGQAPPHQWVQRLRDVHPELLEALGDETLFQC